MRRIAKLFALVALGWLFPASAAVIAEWNFNSAPEDAETSTGSPLPSHGEGALTLIGGANSNFGAVAGGRTSDTAATDNSQMRITGLPSLNEENKSVAVEFTFSTVGFENVTFGWDQYNSPTASRYWRIQLSTDGAGWSDHDLVVNTNPSVWKRYDVALPAAANDQLFLGIRLTPEWESTAAGTGAEGYVAVRDGSNYGAAGSWWMDMVSIRGRPAGTTNTPPVVSAIAEVVLAEGMDSEPIDFMISDSETAVDSLVLTPLISNTEVITNLNLEGTGTDRTLTFRAGIPGETLITLRVTDADGDFAEVSFNATVIPKEIEEPLPENLFEVWNFNSAGADSDPATGTFSPAFGSGEFQVIGTQNHTFGMVGQGRSSDPAAADNSMLRLVSFPAQETANQTAGFEIKASTVGRRNITLLWDQYNSATASRFWRIQYSTNGADFLDFTRVTNSTASSWRRSRRASFENVEGVANNPNFAVRFVSEFGPDGTYVAVGENSFYGAGGTLWLDMVALAGEPDATEPPRLTIQFEGGPRISWPRAAGDFILEAKSDWSDDWSAVERAGVEEEGRMQMSLPADGAAGYFRLRKNPGL